MNYWPSRGYNAQSLNIYKNGTGYKAAGSYSKQVPAVVYSRAWMDSNNFNQWSSYYNNMGYRPRELSVALDSSGQPRFTGIWQKRMSEGYQVWINMNDTDLQNKWNSLVTAQGYRLEDHAVYSVGGQRRHAVIYVKDGKGFYSFWNMNSAALQSRAAEMAGKGYAFKSLNVTEDGQAFSAVFEPAAGTGTTQAMYNMTVESYQQKFEQYVQQGGYRIMKLRGYANGQRFLVIFRK
ncbi:MAG: hypothetical protein EOO61_09375 [Hymenobacter sp.]|nr:MAG: hypothetical protein EOO61_09375 [Hymenobacter sp.]